MSDEPVDADFATFVASLPRDMEADLMGSDIVSTAFFEALHKGWSVEDLASDALHTFHRGASVGVIVSRFRSLSEREPVNRAVVKGAIKPKQTVPQWRAPVWTPLSAAKCAERVAVLRRALEEQAAADVAEADMRAVISGQKGT